MSFNRQNRNKISDFTITKKEVLKITGIVDTAMSERIESENLSVKNPPFDDAGSLPVVQHAVSPSQSVETKRKKLSSFRKTTNRNKKRGQSIVYAKRSGSTFDAAATSTKWIFDDVSGKAATDQDIEQTRKKQKMDIGGPVNASDEHRQASDHSRMHPLHKALNVETGDGKESKDSEKHPVRHAFVRARGEIKPNEAVVEDLGAAAASTPKMATVAANKPATTSVKDAVMAKLRKTLADVEAVSFAKSVRKKPPKEDFFGRVVADGVEQVAETLQAYSGEQIKTLQKDVAVENQTLQAASEGQMEIEANISGLESNALGVLRTSAVEAEYRSTMNTMPDVLPPAVDVLPRESSLDFNDSTAVDFETANDTENYAVSGPAPPSRRSRRARKSVELYSVDRRGQVTYNVSFLPHRAHSSRGKLTGSYRGDDFKIPGNCSIRKLMPAKSDQPSPVPRRVVIERSCGKPTVRDSSLSRPPRRELKPIQRYTVDEWRQVANRASSMPAESWSAHRSGTVESNSGDDEDVKPSGSEANVKVSSNRTLRPRKPVETCQSTASLKMAAKLRQGIREQRRQLQQPKSQTAIKVDLGYRNWTPEENELLKKGILKYGPSFRKIREEFLPQRSASGMSRHASKVPLLASILVAAHKAADKKDGVGRWTPSEKMLLVKGLKEHGTKFHVIHRDYVTTRTVLTTEWFARKHLKHLCHAVKYRYAFAGGGISNYYVELQNKSPLEAKLFQEPASETTSNDNAEIGAFATTPCQVPAGSVVKSVTSRSQRKRTPIDRFHSSAKISITERRKNLLVAKRSPYLLWSPDEDKLLLQGLKKHQNNFNKISSEFLPHRTPRSIARHSLLAYDHMLRDVRELNSTGAWTNEEQSQLIAGLRKLGTNWKIIHDEFVPKRSVAAVENYARKRRYHLTIAQSSCKKPLDVRCSSTL